MTLFQILTRIGLGRMKVTKELIHRVQRETGGKTTPRPARPRRRKRSGTIHPKCALLLAGLMLSIGGVSAAATPVSSHQTNEGYSAAALYNQGNALAREGKIGPAVLAYERARLLSPTDGDIAANLKTVRDHAGLTSSSESGIGLVLTSIQPRTSALLGCFGLVLAGTAILLLHRFPRRRIALLSTIAVGVMFVILSGGNAIAFLPRMSAAVVLGNDASVRVSPTAAAAPAFQLKEGEIVRLSAEHHGFTLVNTADGRSGWLADDAIERIVPNSRPSTANIDHT